MSSRTLLSVVGLLAIAGCDRDGTDLLPPNSNFDPVVTIGELKVLSPGEYFDYRVASNHYDWCAQGADVDGDGQVDEGSQYCYYGQLGMPEAGVKGGSSFTFTVPEGPQLVSGIEGTEDAVYEEITELCVLVDPETVFWNHSMAELERETKDLIPDFHDDDGDIDLFVGMSSYYTGSPGVELGDFRGFYTDSLGRTIEIEYGECVQRGQTFGEHHAGRGALEFCDIDVEGRGGIQFTAVLESFSVPLNDGALSYGTMVYGGPCSDIVTTPGEELTIPQESMISQSTPEVSTCTWELELATAAELQQEFCCVHPEMCSERAPEDACDAFVELYDPDTATFETAASNFCSLTAYTELEEGSVYGSRDNDATVSSLCCDERALIDVPEPDLNSEELRTISGSPSAL